jgi:ubiquitin carboxyl-terminal hydrolase 8
LSSPRPQSGFDYFAGQNTGHEVRRKGVIGLSTEKSITAQRLFDFLKMYRILLIDVRSRPEFDEGHIDSLSILCVEPLQLREGISAEEIEGSLSISPDEEEGLFMARDQFDLVVYYDQASSSTDFLLASRTEKDKKLRILYEALVEFNIEKPLKSPPMLLTGGIEAWTDLLGRPALRTTMTQVRKGPRRTPSVASSLPSSLMIGKKRVRDFNPLNADEEREWAERARSESIHIATISDVEEDQPLEGSLPFYRTEEEFFRRFPAVPVEQQSMVSPMDSGVSSPVSRPPSLVHSQVLPPYPDSSFGSQGDMPVRPAPAAPRVSYSGAHDRNAIPPYNTVRTRYPPPYISPNEKPAMVRLPRTGLVNFGSTCYMNSVLQCLSATVPLTRRFQDGSYKQWLQRENWKGSRGLLPEVYASLVQNLWVNDIPACRPVTFRVSCALAPE